MPVQQTYWEWEEAFNKFGFGDGDVMRVETRLEALV